MSLDLYGLLVFYYWIAVVCIWGFLEVDSAYGIGNFKRFSILLVATLLFTSTWEYNYKTEQLGTKVSAREIVSTKPPTLKTEGEGHWGFLYGSMYINSKIFYILREEVSLEEYRDFVQQDATIKEDDTLVDTGFVNTYYECKRVYTKLFLIEFTEDSCLKAKTVIHVPKGAVQKGMKI